MKWYYAENKKPIGPVSEQDILALAGAGKITPDTLVWNRGFEGWKKFGKVKKRMAVAPPEKAGKPEKEEKERSIQPSENTVCSECGKAFPADELIQLADARVCAGCKPAFIQKLKEGVHISGSMRYGGFWIRFGAKFVDGLILGAVNMVLSFLALAGAASSPESRMAAMGPLMAWFVQMAIAVVYTTWFLGKFGATPGKMACKLKVVTAEGDKISYGRAFGRHFAEMLSSIILAIGYIMAAFDSEKRTLHDRICSTRVVRK